MLPTSRRRLDPRFDKNVSKKRKVTVHEESKPTEAKWLQQRREDVSQKLSECGVEADVATITDLVQAGVWTERHDAEVNFNCRKQMARLLEALHSKTVRQEEVPECVYDMYLKHYEDKARNMKDRERAELRMSRMTNQSCPSEEALQGCSVWVLDEADRTRAICAAFDRRGWSLTMELREAQVILTSQPSNCPTHITLAAGLGGAWVVTPEMVLSNRGYALKYKDQPSSAKRKVFVSPAAELEHPDSAAVIRGRASRNWILLDSLEHFAESKQRAMDQKLSSSVVALIGDQQSHIFQDVRHAFCMNQFVDFFCRVDMEQSCVGL